MNTAAKTSRRRLLVGLAAGGLSLATRFARAQAQDGAVVLVNARNPTQSLSFADVQKIFLGQTAFWHAVVPVKVFLRPDATPAATAFYEPVLKMKAQAFRKYWDEAQLAGRGVTPKTIGSAEEVAKTIASTAGGIGWALSSEAWKLEGVKIIQVK